MILKEIFRYQNYLNGLLDKAYSYLNNPQFVTKTTEIHEKNKANKEANDEVIEVQKPFSTSEFEPNQIIDFVVRLINEKQAVSDAITKSKREMEIDYDAAIEMNKQRQKLVTLFRALDVFRTSITDTYGTDYRFNNEGTQVPYRYPVRKTVEIDFDRVSVKGLAKKYQKEADEISTKLDTLLITTDVDFTPKYTIGDTFEEAVLL